MKNSYFTRREEWTVLKKKELYLSNAVVVTVSWSNDLEIICFICWCEQLPECGTHTYFQKVQVSNRGHSFCITCLETFTHQLSRCYSHCVSNAGWCRCQTVPGECGFILCLGGKTTENLTPPFIAWFSFTHYFAHTENHFFRL